MIKTTNRNIMDRGCSPGSLDHIDDKDNQPQLHCHAQLAKPSNSQLENVQESNFSDTAYNSAYNIR